MEGKANFKLFKEGEFIVTLVGIILNKKTRRILIGKREGDKLVPELKWSFPGGKLESATNLEEHLLNEIKKKTGLEKVDIKKILLARITPEIERKQIILYYYCETDKNEEDAGAGEKFVEVKWINSKDWKNYFATSVHPNIIKFLEKLK